MSGAGRISLEYRGVCFRKWRDKLDTLDRCVRCCCGAVGVCTESLGCDVALKTEVRGDEVVCVGNWVNEDRVGVCGGRGGWLGLRWSR